MAPSVTGVASPDKYDGAFSGPSNFGSGGRTVASSGSGDYVDMLAPPLGGALLLPHGYISGNPLSDTATYDNATFASLGVTPGKYEWTWGTGPNQNFTLQIGPAGVPDTGSSFALLLVALSALIGVARFRSVRLA